MGQLSLLNRTTALVGHEKYVYTESIGAQVKYGMMWPLFKLDITSCCIAFYYLYERTRKTI